MSKEARELKEAVLREFPSAEHGNYLVGRDSTPTDSLVFCDGDLVRAVAAFQTGKRGWVINQMPNGAGGFVLWRRDGNVRKRRHG